MYPSVTHGDQVVIYLTQDVEYGDIILFNYKDGQLLKRVVGMPGDRFFTTPHGVLFSDPKHTVKNESYVTLKEEYVLPYLINCGDPKVHQVPPGHVFVLGDNRPFSGDSREIGPIPIKSIRGKAIFRLLRKL
jgi:signal peptidase I